MSEREELDEAVAELEVSRADLIRQCVLDFLERRREASDLVASLGEFVVVDGAGDEVPRG